MSCQCGNISRCVQLCLVANKDFTRFPRDETDLREEVGEVSADGCEHVLGRNCVLVAAVPLMHQLS